MSAPIRHGLKLVFGIPAEQKPIVGLPAGKVRLRFRHQDVAKAFVRTATGLEYFLLSDQGDMWGLLKRGENRRFRSQ